METPVGKRKERESCTPDSLEKAEKNTRLFSPIERKNESEMSVHSFEGTWEKGRTNSILVEILGLNGSPFRGSFNRSDGLFVYDEVLKLSDELLHGVSVTFKRNPMIRFKLTDMINIDDLGEREDFSYNWGKPKADGSYDIINGRILGIRKRGASLNPSTFDPIDQPLTKVSLFGCDFGFSRDMLVQWMGAFGTVLDEPLEIVDESIRGKGTGDFTINLKLKKNIPQFLPINGKKVRVSYRGMKRLCNSCFEPGHERRDCKAERILWIDYVVAFIEITKFPSDWYGRWANVAENVRKQRADRNEERKKRPQILNIPNVEDIEEEKETETEMETETEREMEESQPASFSATLGKESWRLTHSTPGGSNQNEKQKAIETVKNWKKKSTEGKEEAARKQQDTSELG